MNNIDSIVNVRILDLILTTKLQKDYILNMKDTLERCFLRLQNKIQNFNPPRQYDFQFSGEFTVRKTEVIENDISKKLHIRKISLFLDKRDTGLVGASKTEINFFREKFEKISDDYLLNFIECLFHNAEDFSVKARIFKAFNYIQPKGLTKEDSFYYPLSGLQYETINNTSILEEEKFTFKKERNRHLTKRRSPLNGKRK